MRLWSEAERSVRVRVRVRAKGLGEMWSWVRKGREAEGKRIERWTGWVAGKPGRSLTSKLSLWPGRGCEGGEEGGSGRVGGRVEESVESGYEGLDCV